MCSVPVSGYRLIVPDSGGFCVTEVTWLPSVMGWINKQGLCREGFQVSGLVILHVLRSEDEKTILLAETTLAQHH